MTSTDDWAASEAAKLASDSRDQPWTNTQLSTDFFGQKRFTLTTEGYTLPFQVPPPSEALPRTDPKNQTDWINVSELPFSITVSFGNKILPIVFHAISNMNVSADSNPTMGTTYVDELGPSESIDVSVEVPIRIQLQTPRGDPMTLALRAGPPTIMGGLAAIRGPARLWLKLAPKDSDQHPFYQPLLFQTSAVSGPDPPPPSF